MKKILNKKIRSLFDGLFCNKNYKIRHYGSDCAWPINVDNFLKNPVVVSGGAGKDISFELEIIDKLDATVYLFDPSDVGNKTIRDAKNRREQLHFFPKGFAGETSKFSFMPPLNEEEGSFRKPDQDSGEEIVAFECTSVTDFCNEMNVEDGCLLKLDIEGFEYEVLYEVLAKIPKKFSQICVELHHFLPGHSVIDNYKICYTLYTAGYRIVHKNNQDYLFIRKEYI